MLTTHLVLTSNGHICFLLSKAPFFLLSRFLQWCWDREQEGTRNTGIGPSASIAVLLFVPPWCEPQNESDHSKLTNKQVVSFLQWLGCQLEISLIEPNLQTSCDCAKVSLHEYVIRNLISLSLIFSVSFLLVGRGEFREWFEPMEMSENWVRYAQDIERTEIYALKYYHYWIYNFNFSF